MNIKNIADAKNANDVSGLIYSTPATGLIITQYVAPSCGFCVKLLFVKLLKKI